ncbi:MAG TPA: lysophospholipid acyltransferase family protein [Polyangiaceae bacterium]|nr:lysophospholipid acyltransferase family protein [Polyangiaceae bacterium]
MTLAVLAKAVVSTAKISVPTLVEAARGKLDPKTCDERLDQWSRSLLEDAKIQLTVRGLEHAVSDENFVVMSNHQSLYDIPVLFQALRRRIRMVAKRELFRVPVWGRAMRAAGFIEVDRDDHERAVESLRRAADAIEHGNDVWIAPEGTRSRDGSLQPFRKGGFHLALAAGARILPVSIDGTRRVLEARGFRVHPGASVRVSVHLPLDPRAHSANEIEELMTRVRESILEGLPAEAEKESAARLS